MTPIKVALIGALGRMGQEVIKACEHHPDILVAACLTRNGNNSAVNTAIKPAPYQTKQEFLKAPKDIDVVLDFSLGCALKENLTFAHILKKPFILASSGYSSEDFALAQKLAKDIPILVAPNTSLMMNIMAYVAEIAAKHLPNASKHLHEIHHKQKKDAPSGTALFLKEKIGAQNLDITFTRAGLGNSEHLITLFHDYERLKISHEAYHPSALVQGALEAVKFINNQRPQLYDMFHVLNLKQE